MRIPVDLFVVVGGTGDSLSNLQKAVEMREATRQQLREQLEAVEKETRSKLLEIDAFNAQLKVHNTLTRAHTAEWRQTGLRELRRILSVLYSVFLC